jgi:phosphopantothenoylcysteine decarboxylase/phosphopantothenate--cysteine ligase
MVKIQQLEGKKVIIAITGGVAAYKIPLLIRLLKRSGAEVKVLLTAKAKAFVTPLTLSVLSENPVISSSFDEHSGSWESHIDLGLWADLIVLAPLTANTMGKIASGVADNILLTTLLSARCPVLFAPAMDMDMFAHPSTQKNIAVLQSYGYTYIAPEDGFLASGLSGAGRLPEPETLYKNIVQAFQPNLRFAGKTVLVSAGPTYEKIDPVRFIGNFSSGKMGFAIAEAFASQGAKVFLVSGPTHLKTKNPNVELIDVVSAAEMYERIHALFPKSDITVMAAAVADYTPKVKAKNKIKKKASEFEIELVATQDILKSLGKIKHENQILIGFALETNDEKKNALKKLKNKNLDFIVLNSLQDKGAGFATSTNKVTILDKYGNSTAFELKSKAGVALDILDYIEKIK